MKKPLSIVATFLVVSVVLTIFTVQIGRSFSVPPTMEWDRTYGGIGSDKAYSLVKTNDGGYAVAGDTNSFGAGSRDFWLVKTDSNGNEQWNKTYGGTGDDYYAILGHSLVQTSDRGYALAGSTNSFGAGDYDFWLVKTDANGKMQWNKTYGGMNDESMLGMIQTNDGGYAMVGGTNSFGVGGYDCWFVKTDSSGNMQWNKTYGSPSYDERGYAVVQTSDGAYALLGSNHTGYERNDVLLFRLNSNGDVEWKKTYNRSYQNDFGDALVQNSDGGFTIAGLASSSWAEEYDGWLFRTDANGNMLWNRTYGGGATDQFTLMCLTDDGGYGMAGATRSFGAGGFFDFWLVKVDASGNMQWNKTYGGTGWDEARCIVETGDGGYAVAGWTDTFGAGSDDFWLIKLAPLKIPATLDIDPNSLNLRSKGRWITAYIELPEGYDVADIDVSSIFLNETIPVDPSAPIAVGDYDHDTIPDLMVKFDRAKVISYVLGNIDIEERFTTVTLTITGKLYDGTPFQGSDTIKIIMPMLGHWRFLEFY